MKNDKYKVMGITKIVKAKERDLLEFIAMQTFYGIAKSTDDWKIAYETLVFIDDKEATR